ncbi:MAG TPA: glycosyltransferase [Methylophilaceae bacterium]|nr:glycosyltransferase [Methylophilaceae bacterium]
MKVLLLAPQPFYTERGTPIAIRLLVRSLCRDGHEVDVLTYHEGEDIQIPGMHLFRIKSPLGIKNVPIGFSIKKLMCDLWLIFATFKCMRNRKYEVVHAIEESVFIALLARLVWRFKLVYDMDSLMADQIVEKWPRLKPMLPFMQWFEKFAVKRADLVLAVCPAIAERAGISSNPEKVHLTPDVAMSPAGQLIEVEDVRSMCIASAPVAMYVGNLETYQGVDLLLESLALMQTSQRCSLVIIGGNPAHIERYRQKIEIAGLTQHIHLLGQRPLDCLAGYLSQADIVCSPRLKGVNTPMKIYAYMLSGKALLATDILSHSQVLDSECALLVSPDPSAMAEGLLKLCVSPALRQQLGIAAAQRAGSQYSEKAFETRLRNAYAHLGNAGHIAEVVA